MRLKSEVEILDPSVRKKIIEEINGTENKLRKSEAFRRWKVYRDKTSVFVTDLLLQQFSEETVREMTYSITNISLVRKIINKLARVYTNGVDREIIDNEEATEKMSQLVDMLNFDSKMKTQNRILRLQKNGALYIKPCPFIDGDGNKSMRLKINPLNPYLYDAVEDYYDRTRPMVYILSNFEHDNLLYTSQDPARVRTLSGVRQGFGQSLGLGGQTNMPLGDNKDQTIADSPEDEGKSEEKEYIWWTDKYHFTTRGNQFIDENGIMFDTNDSEDERLLNPISINPIVNFAIDQDNSFWAEGGEDLVDSAIVVNSMLTQINHIGVVQGYGQFFMTGKNLPRNVSVGPNRSIQLEYEDGDPKPELGFATASPPLRELMQNAESLVALALTTNDLSTSGVSAQLDGSGTFPSGIAMLIDKAESQEEVKDQRQMFIDNEKIIWEIISKWMLNFSQEGILDEDFQDLLLPEEFDLSLNFGEINSVITEGEKLDNLIKRKDLGINTKEELIMLDRPDLSREDAEVKLKEIQEERKESMEMFAPRINDNEQEKEVDDGDQGNEVESEQQQDSE